MKIVVNYDTVVNGITIGNKVKISLKKKMECKLIKKHGGEGGKEDVIQLSNDARIIKMTGQYVRGCRLKNMKNPRKL